MNNNPSGEQRESFEQANQPVLCARGCGFFGNPASQNLCSKCYRDFCQEKEQGEKAQEKAKDLLKGAAANDHSVSPAQFFNNTSTAATVPAAPSRVAVSPTVEAVPSTPGDGGAAGESTSESQQPVQKNMNRCFECNKRVGLTGFKCRCGYVFCGSHRYAEAHKCSFDYKAMERQKLARNNPIVMSSKIEKL